MIDRKPGRAARTEYELIVVGGGVQGVTIALEAARRGQKVLLLDKGDFGSATSWNSLRIVHGGLRYLQTLNLARSRESARERAWLVKQFPEQFQPLSCIMPLYGEGLRRPSVFRWALVANSLLCGNGESSIGRGRILGITETRTRVPLLESSGLMGSAKWFDAVMLNPQRLLMEMLRWACSAGATALNYMEVTGLFENDGARWGLRATDRLTGHSCSFHGAHIVVAAGPWSGALEDRLGLTPEAPFHPSLAFNVLLDRKPVAPGALALSSSRPNGNTLFLHECNGRLFAGTAHRPLQGKINGEPPDETIVAGFLDELNAAIPSLECSPRDVLRLFWGYLPVAEPGTTRLESRSRIWSYGSHGGQRGIYSVQGVKFTTARSVAEKTLRTISKHNGEPMPPRIPAPKPESRQVPDLAQFKQLLKSEPDKLTSCIQAIIREESATCLSDIVLRRTDWGLHQSEKPRVEAALEELLGWQGDGEMRREDLVN